MYKITYKEGDFEITYEAPSIDEVIKLKNAAEQDEEKIHIKIDPLNPKNVIIESDLVGKTIGEVLSKRIAYGGCCI